MHDANVWRDTRWFSLAPAPSQIERKASDGVIISQKEARKSRMRQAALAMCKDRMKHGQIMQRFNLTSNEVLCIR